MKTTELTGAALDWAVAKCENEPYIPTPTTNGIGMSFDATEYSTDWALGGPIIEREGICIGCIGVNYWIASPDAESSKDTSGSTPLIAAMRCYVASKLGDEVEIPKEFRE
jgi:hypothetical protein